MPEFEKAPTTAFDICELALTMRPDEVAEVRASTGMTPLEALAHGLDISAECWTARVDGKVMAIWGVVADPNTMLTNGLGLGWLLTSDVVDQNKSLFWRECIAELQRLLQDWRGLYNAIDCRHHKALRWAQRLGFMMSDPAPYGPEGLAFVRFLVTKECLNVQPGRGTSSPNPGIDSSVHVRPEEGRRL